ncbi:3-coathanger stack domain-containing protein [Emticicia agri]|uniref:Uncharacterized protein n=1 Tax=Emticicia agri TaxID=2492393 RepID=A0A4Q5LY41_9BACT|nr:3-coathanger stack domain-containing protein [Emticicia agri]RYU94555.1 hypothetical protein EWM59_16480 [Emticicia agri]
MKTRLPEILKLFTILLLFIYSKQSIAQVINGSYTIEIHYLQGYGYIDTDPTTAGEQTHTAKVALNNGFGEAPILFDLSSGASNQPKTCYVDHTDANRWGPVVDYNIGTLYGSTNGRFDYTFFSWEDDAGSECNWDSDDDNRGYGWGYRFATNYTQASWYSYPDIAGGTNNTLERIKSTWRFTNGEKTSALDFGTLSNTTYAHINTNRGVPAGAATALGYKNQWTDATALSFKPGNDVTYKFRITSAKRIIFSTVYSESNFDTYIHLVRLNEDGSFNSYVDGDDDDGGNQKSYLQSDLCPGLYGVIVEGYSAAALGDFKLTLQVSGISVTAGTIAISTNNGQSLSLCPNATIPAINSTANSTSTLGNIIYYWKRRTFNNGNWSAWADYTAAGNGVSASNLGSIENNEIIEFQREAQDCGSGAGSNVVTFNRYTPTISAGTIGGSTMIPSPRELPLGTMTSVADASGIPSITISWEKDEGSGWGPATPAGTNQAYSLPELTVTTKFRRKATNACPTVVAVYSNEQTITVINPNGVLQGRVTSKTGAGVNNVTISAKRTTAVTGGLANKTYTTTTGTDGTYAIPGVYYGSTAIGSGATANFTITPSKGVHIFEQTSLTRTVSQTLPVPPDANFVDKTVFSVLGKVTQECATCVGGTVQAPIVCPAANVEFLVDNTYLGNKTLTDGTYALSMDEQRNYTIKPRYKNHTFTPAQLVLPVGESPSTENVNFVDNTTHTISGTFFAGCNEYIGQATLKFSQILPDINGNPVTGCLIKTVTTNLTSGAYSITLPAGKYRVSFESFIPGGSGTDLNPLTVKDFMNQKVLVHDSLTRDIDEKDKILNLVYPRAPVLEVIGLNTICTPTGNVCTPAQLAKPYSLMAQNDSTAFTIKVWQGAPAKNCPAKDSLVYLHTNIQQDDTNQDFIFANLTGTISKKLKGGLPNIVCPYFKTFNLQYADKYKRSATDINKNVVVTGLKSDIGTFTTISPELPLKILHDPQGDLSYSFWEANKTSEQAIRFFRSETDNTNGWVDVKLGTKFEAGIGLTVESAFWGSIKGSINTGARNVTSSESILSISNTQLFSTANNEDVVGAQGDVYIGSAMNLLYSKTHVLTYKNSCLLTLKDDFIIAPDGFATEYVYSEDHIVKTVIPTLRAFRDNPSNTPPERARYSNQVSVWEQTLANNAINKKRAPFEKNISFDGAAGEIRNTTTATSTKSSTIEFGLEVNEELATELGMEIGGSGLSGGVIINSKVETGGSTTNTTIMSTTTGYSLDDGDNGDYFSIDIKKDPVYDTPVFQLVAGTSSCPWEEGTQPRDEMQLVCAIPSVSNIPAAGEAEFTLLLSNTSQSGESRTYLLSFDQSSNPSGAVVTIGGSPVVGNTAYTIGYLGSVQVVVKVKRGASNIYSYTGLKFNLSDACDGSIKKSVALSAFFNSPCSNITLFSPDNNFSVITNVVPVIMKDYTIANLTSVSLEYSKEGTSNWSTAFTRTAAQLSADPSGTQVNWDISNIIDGKYNVRLKLLCASNVTYSQTITGIIDRVAPKLFGSPEPTDDNYVIGDQISATFNETLGCANLNNNNLTIKNLKTNAIIAAQLGCFDNKIMIVPLASMGATSDSIRVTLQNIQDLYGNVKTTPDSWKFILGTSVAATGNKALSMNSNNTIPTVQSGVLTNAGSISISMLENANGTLDFYFNLPAAAPNDFLINYSVSGSASAGTDYTASFFPASRVDGKKITSNQFNGSFGTITILSGQKSARLLIDPIGDTKFEGDETVIITVNEGGDYGIGASYTMTGIIRNDDADDCLNGGNVYTVSNNTNGNTSIAAGTYQKSLLESNGTIVSPTNVTMKGAKSVVMKPGFEVKAGAIFKAIIEGCPPVSSGYSIPTKDTPDLTADTDNTPSFNTEASTPTTQVTSSISYEPNVLAAVSDKKIYFQFTLDKDEEVTLTLYNAFAGEVLKVIDNTHYKGGTYTAEIETATLTKGDYFIQMITKDKKTYQKITVTK